MNDEWLDDLLDGKPTSITDTQWLIIESNIQYTLFEQRWKSDVLSKLNDLTELEAEEIITMINENRYETDTREQWKKMLKDGVFGNRDF